MMHLTGLTKKINHYPGYRALQTERTVNAKTGKPAAVFSFQVKIKGGVSFLPKSTAAGLLFCWLWEALK